MTIRWGAAARPKEGQMISGDAYVVLEYEHGLLIAMIDGLGGGEEAAKAAQGAVKTVNEFAQRPLKEIIERCHTALHGTRGAVMGLLRLDVKARSAAYTGIGNTGIHVLTSQTIKPISRNGILGHRQLPSLLEMNYTYNGGDVFVLYTDGISTRFISEASQLRKSEEPQMMADHILAQYGKSNDDATVVVLATGA